MFYGVSWNQPICRSVRVFVCVQDITCCESASVGIKSHLVIAQVFYYGFQLESLLCYRIGLYTNFRRHFFFENKHLHCYILELFVGPLLNLLFGLK